MAADKVQLLDLKDLDAVLARAKAEEWVELALIGGPQPARFAAEVVGKGWPATRVFALKEPLQRVPNALFELTHLKTLDLWANKVGDDGATAISKLAGLTSLALRDTEIGDAGAEAIARLSKVTSLNLSANNIRDSGAKAIAKLNNLNRLDLEYNSISDEGAECIAQLSGLTALCLNECWVGDSGATAIAGLAGLTSLDLAGNRMGDAGAEAIARLRSLTSLNLGWNKIGRTGIEAIAGLTGLTSLKLGGIEIGDAGVAAIARLTRLTSLDLSHSGVGDPGAATIAELTGLSSLVLYTNHIGDAGAEAIARLPDLTALNLMDNLIGDVGAEAIAQISGLSKLVLRRNQIGAVGLRALLDAWAEPATADRRRHLDLGENQALRELLPAEVLNQTDAQALIAAWRRFRGSERRPLNEAKLIVVGNGNVGKTSLVHYMTTGRPRDPAEPTTEGVRTYERIETARWTPEGSSFTLNIWDFGGQEIYFGTHRYFLTARSLYLLVLDDRTDGPGDAEDWLRRIRSHAAEAPVIVAVNKAGEGGPGLRLDEAGLMERHGPIVAFLRTSCEPDNDKGIAALREQIATTLADAALMPDVHQRYPEPWWQVKDALAVQARDARFVGAYDFRRLCESNGIEDEHEQRGLLATLHELGTVVAYGADPKARAVHREAMILDPNWLTQAIYTILGSAPVRDQNGEFTLGDLGNLLKKELYPEHLHELIVALMLDEKLGLCLELEGHPRRYLLPAALPPSVPELGASAFKPCRRFRYNALPGDLMPRFMVQVRDLIASGSARWRDGVVLTVHRCGVLVRAAPDPMEQRVDVALDASPENSDPRRALDRLEEAFVRVHGQFGAIGVRTFVPLPGTPEEDVELAVLHRLEREGRSIYRHESAVGTRDYPLTELLSGMRAAVTMEAEKSTRLQRFLAWIETWPGTATLASAFMAIAALVLLPLPWREWDQKAGWAVVIAVVTYLLVRRSDPELIYRRLLWLTVPGSLAMLVLGASLHVGVWTPDAFVQGQIGTASIWAPVVAVVAVTSILAAADICLTRLRRG